MKYSSAILLLSQVLSSSLHLTDAAATRKTAKKTAKKGKPTSCSNSDFCSGIRFPLIGGGCSDPYDICNDWDDTTEDSCDPLTLSCSHEMIDPSDPTCKQTCEPDCDGKECGENGCGGFCGTCADGLACSNYLCSAGKCSPEY